jgi:hypothetical protein
MDTFYNSQHLASIIKKNHGINLLERQVLGKKTVQVSKISRNEKK